MYRLPYISLFRDFNNSNIDDELEDAYFFEENIGFWLINLTVIEWIITMSLKKFHFTETNDFLTSISTTTFMHLWKSSFRWIDTGVYTWIYKNYAIIHLPNTLGVFLIQFTIIDFMFYWFHRAAHEVNIFWATHQVHHSSEYYNFTTALRKGFIELTVGFWFHIPFAFVFPPQQQFIYLTVNLTYQYFIHTELIGNLGPLEKVLNTPSHHRLHHARNRYCIDKNYGGILIVWDKLFGTFESERKGEPLAYGLVHNVNTFNQMYIQFFHFKNIFTQFISMNTLRDKLKTLFYGPGWNPGCKNRLGNREDIPNIEYPIVKYNPSVPMWFKGYAVVHAYISMMMYMAFIDNLDNISTTSIVLISAYFVYAMHCNSCFWDKWKNAPLFEVIRCIVTILWISSVESQHIVIKFSIYVTRLIMMLSVGFWLKKLSK